MRAVVATLALAAVGLAGSFPGRAASAQPTGPTMLHPGLAVQTVVSGLSAPTTLAFIGAHDLLVLEKNTGRVQRVTGGAVQGTVLDLAVNFGSERGLLGIALHRRFPSNPGVYLYWTQSTTGALGSQSTAKRPLLPVGLPSRLTSMRYSALLRRGSRSLNSAIR